MYTLSHYKAAASRSTLSSSSAAAVGARSRSRIPGNPADLNAFLHVDFIDRVNHSTRSGSRAVIPLGFDTVEKSTVTEALVGMIVIVWETKEFGVSMENLLAKQQNLKQAIVNIQTKHMLAQANKGRHTDLVLKHCYAVASHRKDLRGAEEAMRRLFNKSMDEIATVLQEQEEHDESCASPGNRRPSALKNGTFYQAREEPKSTRRKAVSFSTVTIREYNSLSISLSWAHDEETHVVAINTYEIIRSRHRRR